MVFVFGYHSFNSSNKYELPHIAGDFSEWGITSCESGDGFVNISGWASPKNAFKLKTELYLKDEKEGGYYKIKTLMYQRGHETDEMKANRYFDNSGFVSALRLPFIQSTSSKKIIIVSLGRDGEWYRGEYDCSK